MVRKHLNIIIALLILLVSLPVSMAVAAKDKVAPVVSQTKVTTNGDKDVTVSFNLSEKAKVSINVYQGTKLVKKGFDKVTTNAGKVNWSWKGTKAAATYTVKIDATDLAGNKAKTNSGSIKVTAPTNDDLNTKGVFNRSFNLTKAGAKYGPATGNNVINGNVTVKGDKVTLKNTTINGTLIVDPGANGEAVLDNISAKKVEVLSGAPNSIKVYNLKAPILEVKNDNDVRIVTYAGTQIGQTNVASGATLQTNGDANFGNVDIKVTNQKVKLDGTFSQVTVSGSDTRVEAGTGAIITTVKVVAPVELSGDFSSAKVSVEANNVKVTVAASTQVKEIEVNAKATVTADKTAKITTVDVRADVKLEGTISGTVTISVNNITYTIGEGAVVTEIKRGDGVTSVTPIIPASPNSGGDYIPLPVVSNVTAGPIIQGTIISATSNMVGNLYLVPAATQVNKTAIEAAGIAANGTKAVAVAGQGASLATTGFALGSYKIYAIDASGNISTPVNVSIIDLTNVGINVAAGQITGTAANTMEYSLDSTNGTDGTWATCNANNTSVTFVAGKVYVRLTNNHSTVREVATVASSAAAPSLVYNDVNNTITGLNNTYEYRINGGTWTSGEVSGNFSGNKVVEVRVKATATALASQIQTINFSELELVGYNVLLGNLTNTATNLEYSLNSTDGISGTWADCLANSTPVTFVPGKVFVRVKATPSNYREVATIAAAAAAPSGVTFNIADKTITGTTAAMEYRINDGIWKDALGSAVSNVVFAPGTVEVRLKATATVLPSQSTSMTIAPAASAPTGITYNVAAMTISGTDTTMEYRINGGAWTTASAGTTTNVNFVAGTVEIRVKATPTALASQIAVLGTIPNAYVAPSLVANDYTDTITGLGSTFEYKIDTGNWTSGEIPGDFSGAKTIQIRKKATATDLASAIQTVTFTSAFDNSASFTLEAEFLNIENPSPMFFITADNDLNISANIVIKTVPAGTIVKTFATVTATDGMIYISWDGKNNSSVAVPDGEYTVEAEVTDAAGNVDVASTNILVDRSGPSFNMTYTNDTIDDVSTTDTTIDLDLSDSVYVYFDIYDQTDFVGRHEQKFITPTSQYSYTWDGTIDGIPVADGVYDVKVWVRDTADNMSRAIFTVLVDRNGITQTTAALSPSDISVSNVDNSIDYDNITINNVAYGDKIRVYTSPTGPEVQEFSEVMDSPHYIWLDYPLLDGGGTIYITKTSPGEKESPRVAVTYAAQ